MLRLTLLAVLAVLALPAAGLAGVGETSIFYYPWYGTPAYDGLYQHWAQDGHRPPTDVAATFYPLRGAYSSSDDRVVRPQMHESAAADGFAGVYTYDTVRYGPGTFARLCSKAHAAGLLCAPSVGPGYDATAATSDTRVCLRQNGATYDAMWSAATAADADRITITS